MLLPFEWFDGEGKYAPQEAFPLWIIAGEELEHLVESYVPCFLLDIPTFHHFACKILTEHHSILLYSNVYISIQCFSHP